MSRLRSVSTSLQGLRRFELALRAMRTTGLAYSSRYTMPIWFTLLRCCCGRELEIALVTLDTEQVTHYQTSTLKFAVNSERHNASTRAGIPLTEQAQAWLRSTGEESEAPRRLSHQSMPLWQVLQRLVHRSLAPPRQEQTGAMMRSDQSVRTL
jgi:hypothetical protein